MLSHSGPQATSNLVGFIGLGVMGRPMTLNTLKATEAGTVYIHDRTKDRVEDLLSAGAGWAATPRELAERVDIIILMLPDLPQVEQVLSGPDGLTAGINKPTTLVISSTSSATGIRELADRLSTETNGLVHVVDAPVSGGEEGAKAATLSILVGGNDEDVAKVMGTLSHMGNPRHLGPLGSGEIAKFCNQLIVASTIMALGEAAVLADRSGLDLEALFDILSGGYAGSRILETRKKRLATEDYSPSGAAKYMVKDLMFAREEAQKTGTNAGQLQYLLNAFTDLTERGFGDQDIAVTRAYVESLGKI
ncbi:MAG: NAD(P)-dependent oxidoreductase [Aurantimicrobium sp.]